MILQQQCLQNHGVVLFSNVSLPRCGYSADYSADMANLNPMPLALLLEP